VTTTTIPGISSRIAQDPAGLARQLVVAERGIRDTAATPAQVEQAAQLQQLLYRRLGSHPEWTAQVTAAIPADLRSAVAHNLAAATARRRIAAESPAVPPVTTVPANSTTAPPRPTLPAWRIRAPLPASELLADYRAAQQATGVPWQYLAAINLVETRMGRIVGVSSAGAEGPMQFLPSTWARCCHGDVWNDREAILGAATYLAQSGAPADMTAAILKYNPNEVYLEMVTNYAAVLQADPRAYAGYYDWQVFYGSGAGDVRLPIGYSASAPIDAAHYLASHPQDRL
jgi:membrane-bound lytic murein transglycosylase B